MEHFKKLVLGVDSGVSQGQSQRTPKISFLDIPIHIITNAKTNLRLISNSYLSTLPFIIEKSAFNNFIQKFNR